MVSGGKIVSEIGCKGFGGPRVGLFWVVVLSVASGETSGEATGSISPGVGAGFALG